ncbi:unnamed protein product [Chrysoparadoxa australica]
MGDCKRSRREGKEGAWGQSALPLDLLGLWLGFCSLPDLLNVQSTCRLFNEVGAESSLWKGLVQNSCHFQSAAEVKSFMAHLKLKSYYETAEVLTKLQIPRGILGYWKAEVAYPEEMKEGDKVDTSFNGELLCFRRAPGGFIGYVQCASGAKTSILRIVVRRKQPGKKGFNVQFVSLEDTISRADEAGNVTVTGLGRQFSMRRNGHMRTYSRLSCKETPESSLEVDGQGLGGLWSATCGSHGLEILQVSYFDTIALKKEVEDNRKQVEEQPQQEDWDTASESSCCTSDEGEDSGREDAAPVSLPPLALSKRFLRADKVVGDPHVPTGRCSFVVDLARVCDIDEQLELDSRIFVSFQATGPTLGSLASRRGSMQAWYKGKGQINRNVGVWNPEWVDVDYVLYDSGPVAYSVVWSEPGEAFRVVVDFARLTDDSWPTWTH